MNVLSYESPDKKNRNIFSIQRDELIERLKLDEGLIEVIPMRNPYILVRPYFDIDCIGNKADPLTDILETISETFQCNTDDWAIASAHRDTKLSYHIVCRKYKVTLQYLRFATKQILKKHPSIDEKCLYFSLTDDLESGYFRLPNQSKKSIHKESPPLKILHGNIEEFFVTDVKSLLYFNGISTNIG